MRSSSATQCLCTAALLALLLNATTSLAAIRGKALLLDAPSRVKPGNLLLCTLHGEETTRETLVEGQVLDARFSPDGKQVVYVVDGAIKIIPLDTRVSRELCPCTSNLTTVTWCAGDRILWADGDEMREIWSFDLAAKEKKVLCKGRGGRVTLSLDGKRAAWVMPPICMEIGGKTYGYMGGCGGAVSPGGKYLTSNLTTSHKLMGIFALGDNGPSGKPIATVVAPGNHAFNGFFFGRSDEWVCYTTEDGEKAPPLAYICYWQTGDHFALGKGCIKDYVDETDFVPADAQLDRIAVCTMSPLDIPLTNELVNVGGMLSFRVVGTFTAKGGLFTPRLREGITWKTDAAKVTATAAGCKGVTESGPVTVTAEYKGKTCSFQVTVLPALTGDGFKAEYFSDAGFTNCVLTRIDPTIDFRWDGNASPDPAVNGKAAWAVRWSGSVDVQVDGEYRFFFLQGEGNDGFVKGDGGEKKSRYQVSVDGQVAIACTKDANYPWATPKPSARMALKKGLHTIQVTTVDASVQPVVAQLFWSGPGIRQSLLGAPYVHSGALPAGKP
jgi:hypothetical protein